MSSEMIWMLFDSFVDTCIMVGISGLLGSLFGIPLGVLLYATSAKGIAPMPISNQVVGWIVNAVRSTPFIILMVAIIPLTRFIAGTSIGTAAAIVPLTIAVTPLIARLGKPVFAKSIRVWWKRLLRWEQRITRLSPKCFYRKRCRGS